MATGYKNCENPECTDNDSLFDADEADFCPRCGHKLVDYDVPENTAEEAEEEVIEPEYLDEVQEVEEDAEEVPIDPFENEERH